VNLILGERYLWVNIFYWARITECSPKPKDPCKVERICVAKGPEFEENNYTATQLPYLRIPKQRRS
jgi:hypothetical protein